MGSSQLMDNDNDIINKLRMDVVRLEAKLEISQVALEASRISLEKRLEHMNEFREALREQAASFVTRNELWAFITTSIFLTIALITLIQRFTK